MLDSPWYIGDNPVCAVDDIDGLSLVVDEATEIDESSWEPTTAFSGGGNCILNLEDLATWMEENFCCRHCTVKGQTSSVKLGAVLIGLGTELKFTCDCASSGHTHLETLSPREVVVPIRAREGSSTEKIGKSSQLYKGTRYAINMQFTIDMLYSGSGFVDAESFCGLLGFDRCITNQLWKALEDHIGLIGQDICLEVVQSNLDLELQLSEVDDKGKKILIVSFDMGWQKYSTGRCYNSLSGQAFLIGAVEATRCLDTSMASIR